MSRIGDKPINIPDGVEVEIDDDQILVEGEIGELTQTYKSNFNVEKKDGNVVVHRPSDSKDDKSLHGLYRKLILNMIKGVSEGFEKKLEVSGVGFQVQKKNNSLVLDLGFSHDIVFTPPEDVKIEVPENLQIKVSGADKQRVGEVAAMIRNFHPPEPYKGKGIKYEGEYVRRKVGKTVGIE